MCAISLSSAIYHIIIIVRCLPFCHPKWPIFDTGIVSVTTFVHNLNIIVYVLHLCRVVIIQSADGGDGGDDGNLEWGNI